MSAKYKELYNGVDDQANLNELKAGIHKRIDCSSNQYVDLVTPKIIEYSAAKLRPGKTDPILNITSDCLKNGPAILFSILSYCLQSYIVHGHVSDFLLMSTLVPIVKDKFGDTTCSSNYRSIAKQLGHEDV